MSRELLATPVLAKRRRAAHIRRWRARDDYVGDVDGRGVEDCVPALGYLDVLLQAQVDVVARRSTEAERLGASYVTKRVVRIQRGVRGVDKGCRVEVVDQVLRRLAATVAAVHAYRAAERRVVVGHAGTTARHDAPRSDDR